MKLAWLMLEAIFVLLPLSSCGYCFLCWLGAWKFLRRPVNINNGFTPAISILKPLKGVDPEIYASLRSHCVQEYPGYEIIFGVSDSADPAALCVEQLQKEFPQMPITVVLCKESLGDNVKVGNLAQMLPHAGYQHILVNDSDIRVEHDYLRRVIAPLNDPGVGLVTCLYRGVDGGNLASRLELLGISTDFCGGALAAIEIEGGIHFGLGSTLAFRRADLQASGGFEALVDYLADDYYLARQISQQGLRVHLSEVVVETFLPAYSWAEFIDHQLRWVRNVRDLRGWGYVGAGITFGIPWAVIGLAISRGAWWGWSVLGFTFAVRMLTAWFVGTRVAKDRQVYRFWWLIPLRDAVAILVWVGGFFGSTVVWRGSRFQLHRGKLARVA